MERILREGERRLSGMTKEEAALTGAFGGVSELRDHARHEG